MPRAAIGLTERKVRIAKPGRHADGNGLYLVVDESGAKRWIVRVHVKNQLTSSGTTKRCELGIGNTVLVSLAEARETAIQYQKLARKGVDPRTLRNDVAPSFEVVARGFYEVHKRTLSNPKHAAQWIRTLEVYAFPTLGPIPIDQVDQPKVLQCIEPIWIDKNETAIRVLQRIGKVIDVASSKGLRAGDNPVIVVRNANVLSSRRKGIVAHHAAMNWADVPVFFNQLREQNGTAALALQMTILTAARTTETLEATWAEIDFETCTWTISATRMKARTQHIVPLTDTCVSILNQMQSQSHSEWIFEGMKRGKALSNMAMANVLKRMEVTGATVHGFRTSFRTWCGEKGVEREIAELCLAHQIGSAVEQAYNRSTYLERRREVMFAWERFIAGD